MQIETQTQAAPTTATGTVAVPQDARTPIVKPLSMAARAKAGGAKAAAAKTKGKTETPTVKAPAAIAKKIDLYIDASYADAILKKAKENA